MTGNITRIWCIVFLTLISVILGINSSSLTAFAQDENNPEAEENTQVLDEFSPSPLESTEPDPLLPNPPPVGELLSETQQEKLAPELDKLNAEALLLLEQQDAFGAFSLWSRELRLRRYFGLLPEIAALQRVGLIAWNNSQRLYLKFLVERLEAILQQVNSEETLNLEILEALGTAFKETREKDSAIETYQILLDYARQQQDLLKEEQALSEMGQVYLSWLDYQPAAQAYEQLLETQQQIKLLRSEGILPPPPPPQVNAEGETVNQPSEVISLQELSFIYEQLDQPLKSIAAKERLVGYYSQLQNLQPIPNLKLAIGLNYEKLGQFQQASQNYQEAYTIATPIQQLANASDALGRLARLYRAQNQTQTALELYQAQLLIEQQSYNFYGMMDAYDNIGQIYFDQRAYQRALAAYQQGLQIAQQLKYREDHFVKRIEVVNRQIAP
ncbi:tetratricopeptide repeat protein [Limnoraphis robusta Tam1]|uniref:Tetratricopeptide repeat protein n=1 Tax=Limnoraphis robusta CCNP1315 TaxID=3110306 RepID=A0ABU5TU83_9CYAN|nr:tetratricopeptide repeat protein [Limnoraphis robusta]MEA5496123.1 tetratricopeptide repeat protein [Limnoraphis robusta BA-68 BA1]MEA5518467.1 tetratricopeptide repeat protein [Limnoraphis robusta CCNP1315]MEA5538424.1 tetratricopeptide repeat protein [Limnoraphis robusta Tam1]MEA5545281.1 tetratricopeptide repeat protein [Limnoraphis robusta CCNP1324]